VQRPVHGPRAASFTDAEEIPATRSAAFAFSNGGSEVLLKASSKPVTDLLTHHDTIEVAGNVGDPGVVPPPFPC
jgi:hypothetical protein